MTTVDDDVPPTGIQLGFAVPQEDPFPIAHESPDWRDWDGGQIGGRPSWLNPRDLPAHCLLCRVCQKPLRFLCQLYAPREGQAFHRSLYVFCCSTCCCLSSSQLQPSKLQESQLHEGVRVLRTQLPKLNDFYPDTCDNHATLSSWNQHLSNTHKVALCQVCGQRSQGTCPVQKLPFCGRHHQLEYKKYSKTNEFPSVYPKYEMVVEEEPNENEKEATRDYDITDDDDDDLQEGDTLWGKTPVDPVTTDCLTRLQRAPDQVLRYYPLFKEELLWIRSTPLPPEIPPCPDCGAERRCEFQLVPQMLHYVLQNQQQEGRNIHDLWTDSDKQALSIASELLEHAPPETIPPLLQERHAETLAKIQQHLLQPQQEMDWGTIAVYTCTASCSGHDTDELGAYREEYGWVQPPP